MTFCDKEYVVFAVLWESDKEKQKHIKKVTTALSDYREGTHTLISKS